jgi:DnaK suppressor protein
MPHQASPAHELDLEHFRALLTARRAELIEDDNLAQGAADTVELDQMRQGRLSRMDAMQQQAMAAETHRRRALDLKRVAAALARIDSGEYGYCLTCGEPIAPRRLEFDPAASECIRCAAQHD